MLALERQREIVSLLADKGSARVTELAERFDVTEETIRRDLDKLEGEGKLARSHGGAVAVMSFIPHVVEAFHRIAPHVPVGLTTCSTTASPERSSSNGPGVAEMNRVWPLSRSNSSKRKGRLSSAEGSRKP